MKLQFSRTEAGMAAQEWDSPHPKLMARLSGLSGLSGVRAVYEGGMETVASAWAF